MFISNKHMYGNKPAVREKLLNEHKCLPVFLTDDLVSKYYNGFCNGVLWPLFHYVPLPMYKVSTSSSLLLSLFMSLTL